MTSISMTLSVKQPLKLPLIAQEHERYINELVAKWGEVAKNHNELERDFIGRLMHVWQGNAKYDRPILVNAAPGLGKSTSLQTFLHANVRRDMSFGALIVKEKLDDCEALATSINEGASRPYAFAIKGSNKFADKRLYAKQYDDALNYPVVIISTKMLETRAVCGDLIEKLQPFINVLGENLKRQVLIIDERPAIAQQFSINTDTINAAASALIKAFTHTDEAATATAQRLLTHINALRGYLEDISPDSVQPGKPLKLPPFEHGFTIPRATYRAYRKTQNNEQIETLVHLEHIIKNGGFLDIQQTPVITDSVVVNYPFDEFNAVTILDGTCEIDMKYLAFESYITKPDYVRKYPNVTFLESDEMNFSRSYLRGIEINDKSDAEAIENYQKFLYSTITFAIETSEKSGGKTLIYLNKTATFDELEKLTEKHASIGTKYFDSGRSSNEYTSYDNAIFMGVLSVPSTSIGSEANAILSQQMGGQQLNINSSPRKGLGMQFEDAAVDAFYRNDIVVRTVQEIFRLRPGSEPMRPVAITLIHQSDDIRNGVIDALPGAKRERIYVRSKLIGNQTAADKLAEFISKMQPGDKVKSSVIQREIGVHRSTMAEATKTEKVQYTMKQNGVVKEKTKFIKEADK